MSRPELPSEPNDVQKERRRQLFENLPPGKEPFMMTKESLNGLDRHTRNAVMEEQFFRMSQLSDSGPQMHVSIDCPKHKFRKCVNCLPGFDFQTNTTRGLDVHTKKPCTYCQGIGYLTRQSPFTWGCAHVCEQDPVNPDGVVLTPKRYIVCRTCWDLLERKRLDLRSIIMLCLTCVDEEVRRIEQINPELYDYSRAVDLAPPGADKPYGGPGLILPP